MPSPSAHPLRDVLAAGIKAARTGRGWRQEEAAARLRAQGLTSWRRGTVAQAETGSRRFSLEEVVLVALALETTPAALLVGNDNDQVELAPDTHLTLAALRHLLSGTPEASALGGHRSFSSRRSDRFPDMLAEARRFGIRRHADIERALDGVGDAERHAARKLGTTPERINLAALAQWGRTLAEERDQRVNQQATDETSARGLQALRGHVTRELVTELERHLREKGLL